ncbi:DUF7260 family protein [Halarchaeum nitratireducens]|uniref:DUF7260 domain-containing protein n=1 Tax=Halarchaeum nitratireducens TaxID=489913 RepID=A0A830GDZ9_9EURY|nr:MULTISPECIES: hypothetical protein [Halarchaeum]MBP2251782.1 hypothetical protein [Halarchaeum solikamskense]GGN22336.1 hypothetical protein GCM10009021_24810 [Halarchaeum nitratireducens]
MDETHIERALARVRGERERVDAERTALDRFRKDVESIEPAAATRAAADGSANAGTAVAAGTPNEPASSPECRRVREAFVDTAHDAVTAPDEDRSVSETMREELGWEVARAVSPGTTTAFTTGIKRAVLSAVDERRRELRTLAGALDVEARSLDESREAIEGVAEALVRADGTSPASLGFDGLRERHDALAGHRETCDRVGEERQAVLARSTNRGLVGVEQRALAATLYEPLSVDYPALATVARLDAVLDERQRTVRDHLLRRG